jgi:hypothetical protein
MTEQLIIEESKLEALEEMYFWPVVRDHLPNGDALAGRATGQEQDAKEVLAQLDKLDASEIEFEELLATFTTEAREHIEFEEMQVWPRMRIALNSERAAELGTQIAAGKKTAPTRPHPRAPSSPGVLKTTGLVVAATDKARDARPAGEAAELAVRICLRGAFLVGGALEMLRVCPPFQRRSLRMSSISQPGPSSRRSSTSTANNSIAAWTG